MDWLKELQDIIKKDKELKCNAGYSIAVFDLVRTGIENGGMPARCREDIKNNVKIFKDMIREHYM